MKRYVALVVMMGSCADLEAALVQCEESGRCGAPTQLVATTDDEAAVTLRWTIPFGDTHDQVLVFRDDALIQTLPRDATELRDTEATPGRFLSTPRVTASIDRPTGVELTLRPPNAGAGPEHTYRVGVVTAGGRVRRSPGVAGRRAAPAVASWLIEREGLSIRLDGATATWFDENAPLARPPVVTGSVSATPDDARGVVVLKGINLQAEAAEAPDVRYTARVEAASGLTSSTGEATGRRGGQGPLVLQWQRSVDGGPMENLDGVTGEEWVDAAPRRQAARYRALIGTGNSPGSPVEALQPVTFDGVKAIVAGEDGTCGLRASTGEVRCWGGARGEVPGQGYERLAYYEQLCALRSDGGLTCTLDAGFPAPPDEAFVQVATGKVATCGVTAQGAVRCWGPSAQHAVIRDIPSGTFTQVSARQQHACAVRVDGGVACWGAMAAAQVVPALALPAVQVVTAFGFSSARLSDGTVVDWGDRTNLPARPSAFYRALAEGQGSCAITVDGVVVCPSAGGFGLRAPPGWVTGALELSLGLNHACALLPGGRGRCFGYNVVAAGTSGAAEPLPELDLYQSVDEGDFTVCGIRRDGGLGCWGEGNLFGSLTREPKAATSATTGERHGCAVLAPSGRVDCWASVDDARTQGAPLRDAKRVVAAGDTSCALLRDAGVTCFGTGNTPMVPDAAVKDVCLAISAPASACFVLADGAVACTGAFAGKGDGGTPASMVRCGRFHACALSEAGTLSCWGVGPGSLVPAALARQADFVDVTAGTDFTCALHRDGRPDCWGLSGTPTTPPLGRFTDLAASRLSMCGVRTDGHVVCWGSNLNQQAPRP